MFVVMALYILIVIFQLTWDPSRMSPISDKLIASTNSEFNTFDSRLPPSIVNAPCATKSTLDATNNFWEFRAKY